MRNQQLMSVKTIILIYLAEEYIYEVLMIKILVLEVFKREQLLTLLFKVRQLI